MVVKKVKKAVDAYTNGGVTYRWIIGLLAGILVTSMFGFVTLNQKSHDEVNASIKEISISITRITAKQELILYRIGLIEDSLDE